MLANLASSLIEHGGINTTEARAKELRPYMERLVTLAKRGDLHARRQVLSSLKSRRAVKKLFDEWAPQFLTRPAKSSSEQEWNGGYVRILKLGRRKGDSAPISLVQFITPERAAHPESQKPAKEQTSEPSATGSEAKDNATPSEASS